jgi:hypothetical protein
MWLGIGEGSVIVMMLQYGMSAHFDENGIRAFECVR